MAATVELNCNRCREPFHLKASVHAYRVGRGQTVFYCTIGCRRGRKTFTCAWCQKPISLNISQGAKSKSGRHYCSVEHANKHSGSLKQTRCEDCGKALWSNNRRCMSCYAQTRPSILMMRKCDTTPAQIRKHARTVAVEHGMTEKCGNPLCSYKRHIQACHVRPVEKFDSGALVGEINAPNNLVGLCSRCHWEFDHGMLAIDGARSSPAPSITVTRRSSQFQRQQ